MPIVPAEEEKLPNLATNVLVRARFETSAFNDTPALNFKDVNVVGYLNNTTGTYITRENELTQGIAQPKSMRKRRSRAARPSTGSPATTAAQPGRQ